MNFHRNWEITKELTQKSLKELEDAPKSYGFEHFAIAPSKNICNSRLDADISSEFVRGLKLECPLIAANMSTVTNAEFCIKLRQLGALGILHRAWRNEEDYLNEVKKIAASCDIVAASIGVGDSQWELCKKLVNVGANIITIDIANGYSDNAINLGKKIKQEFSDTKLIIGNTTNAFMAMEVFEFADALKVGISNGYACTTKNITGAIEKQFSAVYKFKKISDQFELPIISDGGIREPADFVKAIAAGANSVMAGSIFAATIESAAKRYGDTKKYFGMASAEAQLEWKGEIKNGTTPEGTVKYLNITGPVSKLINEYAGGLRSGITYAGATNVKDFQSKVEFIRLV